MQTLQFQYTSRPRRKTVAWFLKGNSPAAWLTIISQWNVPHHSLRLLLIPQSITNREPCGLLVISNKDSLEQVAPAGIPYGQTTSRLFLPVEAQIFPEVTNSELQSLLSEQYTYAWHPQCGLVAFEPEDEKTVADFLFGDFNRQTDWIHTIPGNAVLSQLRSISLIELPDFSSLFGQEEKEIGSDAPSLDKLPKAPNESAFDEIPNPLQLPTKWLAKGILSLTKYVPTKTSGPPTWINHLENWASQNLFNAFKPNEAKRNKEINRLLNLLEENPDEGLRFALPMGGDGGYRGIAPPSDSLSMRDINFNLSQMGGGAADFWDIPYDFQMQLLERYRELANREIQLGRYRRAAYIYAHLLGDYGAAAQTLAAGRQWREAAALYKEKLNKPEEAAKCLIQGGLWAEAIAHYEELKEYEKVGDLHRKLDQDEAAVKSYRQAVDHFHQQRSHIEASRILEEKLHATDEAIEELEAGWPHSSQAKRCLENLFGLYTKHGFHQSAHQKIHDLSEMNLTLSDRLPLVQFLTETTTTYPDRAVCEHAEENARVLVSRSLKQANNSQKKELLSHLSQLVPSDKLLQRDTGRYLQQIKQKPKAPKRRLQNSAINLVRTIELSQEVDWKTAVCLGNSIFAAGYHDTSLVVERCLWDGTVDHHRLKWSLSPGDIHAYPILLIPGSTTPDHSLMVRAVTARDNFKDQTFPENDRFPDSVTVGDIKGLSHIILGATPGSLNGVSWNLAIQRNQLLTSSYNQQGYLIASHTIPILEDLTLQIPIPCLERRNKLYFALGNQLGILDSQEAHFEEFHRPIKSMVASTPNTQVRIALSFDQGGTVIWSGYGPNTTCSFGEGLDDPIACFNRKGNLIVSGSGTLEIYKTQQQKLEMIKSSTLNSPDPIAVLASNHADQIGLLDQSGNISVYQCD
ncbi:hypothetical protein [Gimesia alba]|nr:hypothetical protein [Gimesia alba]